MDESSTLRFAPISSSLDVVYVVAVVAAGASESGVTPHASSLAVE